MIAITTTHTDTPSLEPAGSDPMNCFIPPETVTNYGDYGEPPYIDAGQAIGLTVKNGEGKPELYVVAAVGIQTKDVSAGCGGGRSKNRH